MFILDTQFIVNTILLIANVIVFSIFMIIFFKIIKWLKKKK